MSQSDRHIFRGIKWGLAGLSSLPLSTLAQKSAGRPISNQMVDMLPVQMSFSAFLIIGGLLISSIILFFLYQRRSWKAERALRALSDELGHTRSRLTDVSQTLEEKEAEIRFTNDRYLKILNEAEIGMFQADLTGTCTYINGRLEKLTGLYPKKALKQGLTSAMHKDDVQPFLQAWDEFTKKSQPLDIAVRFVHAKNREVLTRITANKVVNDRKEVESYIGWASDATTFHEQVNRLESDKHHYLHFIEETIEGFYQLRATKPISLKLPKETLANTILEEMKLETCSDTFAALYGATTRSLQDKQISAIPGGCGLFRNQDDVLQFINDSFQTIGVETVRQDPRGNRLNLSNNAIGLIHDNHLVAIWGSQRNISREKRAITALSSQTEFMQHVLNALPADVFVKDARCRYLYVSDQQAKNTGIPVEDWIGKTIFEVIPGTPREADASCINVMKKQQQSTTVTPLELKGKTVWMESIQIPLISEEGVVEGVVGMSIDVTERKTKEEKLERLNDMTKKRLEARDIELKEERQKHTETAISLQSALQKHKVLESELESGKKQFNLQLEAFKSSEVLLKQRQDELTKRQIELEQQLAQRIDEACISSEKQKRAEAALQTAEEAKKEIEEVARRRATQLETELDRRAKAEKELQENRTELEHIRMEHDTLVRRRENELAELQAHQKRELAVITGQQEHALKEETQARQQAEKQLKRTEDNLSKTEARMNELAVQHQEQLETEQRKREQAEQKLGGLVEELNQLRRDFNRRIEAETKELKQELAAKQIREKSLREHEKELHQKIRELEAAVHQAESEVATHSQAQQRAEANLRAIEEQLAQLQSSLAGEIKRETEKAETETALAREAEEQLRHQLEALNHTRKELENRLRQRTAELTDSTAAQQGLKHQLEQREQELASLRNEQQHLLEQHTAALRDEIDGHIQTEQTQREALADLGRKYDNLQSQLSRKEAELAQDIEHRARVEHELKQLQIRFDLNRKQTIEVIRESKQALEAKLASHKHNEKELSQAANDLKEYALELRKEVAQREEELATETARRTELEQQLTAAQEELETSKEDLLDRARATREEMQRQLDKHLQHEDNLERNSAELKKIIAELNGQLEQRNGELEQEQKKGSQLHLEHEKLQHQLDAERKAARAKLDHTRSQFEQEIDSARTSEQQFKKTEAELKRQITELEAEMARHTAAVAEKSKQVDTLQQRLTSQTDSLHKLEAELKKERQEAQHRLQLFEQKAERSLEEQRQLAERQKSELAKAGEDLMRQVNGLDNQLNRKTAELEETATRCAALEKEILQQKQLLQTSHHQLDASARKEIERLEGALITYQKKEAALLNTEQELRQQITGLEEQLRHRSSDLAEESALKQELKKQLKRVEQDLAENRASIESSISKATSELNQRITELEQNEKNLRDQEIALSTQIHRLEFDLASKTREISEAETARQRAEETLKAKLEEAGIHASKAEHRMEELRRKYQMELRSMEDETKALRDAELYYRHLFDDAPEAILLLNPESLTIQAANPAAARLFAVTSPTELKEQAIDMLSTERQANAEISLSAIKPHLQQALENGYASFEWSYRKNRDEFFSGLTSLSALQTNTTAQVIAMIQDISSFKAKQSQLEQTIDDARETNRKTTRLVDDITDAVQSALQPAIAATNDPELTGKLNEKQREKIDEIKHNSLYLIDMMNYRTTISHLADGSDPIATDPTDIRRLLKTIDQQYSAQAEAKKLFFALSFAQQDSQHNIPAEVATDLEKVRYVLTTLLDYAMGTTQKGRMGVHASRSETHGDQVVLAFELAFTSAHKADPLLEDIFAAEQFDENRCTPESDLALSLARRYAQLLGG
jgi:PAS domain S-box-containing protein